MFGYSINALELNLRMEGLEVLLGKVVGDNGYLSKTYMNKIFEIPQEELKERHKRSVLGNNKYEEIDRKVKPNTLKSCQIFCSFLGSKFCEIDMISEINLLDTGPEGATRGVL